MQMNLSTRRGTTSNSSNSNSTGSSSCSGCSSVWTQRYHRWTFISIGTVLCHILIRIVVVMNRNQQFQLAKSDSYNFFTDIDFTTWKRFRQRARDVQLYMYRDEPNMYAKYNHSLWLMNNVDPFFTCPHVQRVGSHGDGGKWTCDPHRLLEESDCLIYSFGSAGAYYFEYGIVSLLQQERNKRLSMSWSNTNGKHNCEIHVFDPDPKYARPNDVQDKNIHYHAWGLRSSTEVLHRHGGFLPEYIFYSFQETLELLGHTHRRIDILKIDCEKCEWSTYDDWLQPQSVYDIRQILIETHGIPPKPSVFFDRFLDLGYVLFSKEINSHPGALPFGTYVEWGFLQLHPNFLKRKPTTVGTGSTTTGTRVVG